MGDVPQPTPNSLCLALRMPHLMAPHNTPLPCLLSFSYHSLSFRDGRCSTCPSWQRSSKWHIPKHPSQQMLLSHGNPCLPSNSPGGTSTPLQPDFSSSSTTEKQLNHLLVSLLNLTPVTLLELGRCHSSTAEECICWVKLAWLLGILGIYFFFFQCVASFLTAQKHFCGQEDFFFFCSNSGVNMP